MRILRLVGGIALITVFTAFSSFAVNQLDPTFNPVTGKAAAEAPVDKGQIAQPDGKVIVWGGSLAADGLAKGQIARLNADGTVDTGFTYCGCHLIRLINVALAPDGKLLVAGVSGVSQALVVRLNSDGSLDASFNSAIPALGGTTATARVWGVQADGKVFVEKELILFQGGIPHTLYRLNADGSLDGGFTLTVMGPSSQTTVTWMTDLQIAPDGKFLYTTVTNGPQGQTANIKRYNPDGTADSTWEIPQFGQTGFAILIRAHGLSIQPDGKVIVAGKFTTVNGFSKAHVARLMPTGNLDLTFTAPAAFLSAGIPRVLQNGQVVVTAVTDGSNLSRLYRLNSDGGQDVGFVPPSFITDVYNRYALDPSERILFFGNSNQPSQRFFRLNASGAEDTTFGPNVADFGDVFALARQSDGKIVVAGEFAQMNGTGRTRIGRVNADGTLDPTFDPGSGFNVRPDSLLVQADGKILALGSFATYNGISRPFVARINPDGSLDTSFTPAFNSLPRAMLLQPDGKIVLVGFFSSVNGTARTGAARLNADGSLDPTFNPVIGSPSLYTVVLSGDGKITIAGSFNGINGFSRVNMARLNTDGSLDPSFNIGSSFGEIRGTWLQPDGRYLTATSDATLTRRNANGTSDATFSTARFRYAAASDQSRINSIIFQANGKFMVAGNFYIINDTIVRDHFVRLNANGTLDPSYVQNDPNAEVRAAISQPDGKVVIGGEFSAVEGVQRAGLARIVTGEATHAAFCDFDGDGRSDIGVYRPSDGNWYLAQSQNGFAVQHFGLSGDKVAAADYDGDGKTDIAIYRDGNWWRINSSNGSVGLNSWGTATDIPLPSDFDADGKADLIFYRPPTGEWFRSGSAGGVSTIQFGIAGDIPLIADMDGDGKSDAAVFRPSNGAWWYLSSVSGVAISVQWGQNGDVPVPADYDGDGKTDLAIWRPSNGAWYVYNSGTGSIAITSWGLSEDRPVPADYDGDGRADVAIYRPSNGIWFILQSTAGFTGLQYGLSTDKAIENAYLP